MKEPFLQNGSDVDGCDDAVLDLIELAEIDEKLFKEIADEISACLSKAREEKRRDIRRALETYAMGSGREG